MPESLWSPPLNSQDAGPCQAPIRPPVDRAGRPARNRPNQETKAHHDDRRFSDAFLPDCPRSRGPGLPFRHFQKTNEKNRLASSPGLIALGGWWPKPPMPKAEPQEGSRAGGPETKSRRLPWVTRLQSSAPRAMWAAKC
jgi:hypothetical protein